MSLVKLCLFVFCVCAIQCGESKYSPQFEKNGVNADFRIIGGKPAKAGEFRGQVSLQNRFYAHICAGTLIDPFHIVTAAHCHQRQKPIGYVMGDDLTVTLHGNETRQRRKIVHFVPHPEFSRETFQNDIAVIRVDEPFKVTETFGPMHRSNSTPTKGIRCTVVGWGYTSNSEDSDISYNLLKTDVFVIDINFCNSSFSYEGAMKPGMFCAGRTKGGGHDACQGDSGGLLTCAPRTLSGVISFGNECGLPNFPGIYSDVSMYKDWIDKILITKDLPEYEFSPFPKPHLVYEMNKGNSAATSSVTTAVAILSVILAILSH
ncbi:trypsin eta-like [Sitodiplosis mosellana]|uniref:trypsin eta-like n=1 Tax=Sitodiplosis mosellana TaxID=263140 RepID=UPI0024440754|nr:trypsin eta-like [Sitodiplosis mosellana]XP_055301715.1 trypsin eta-like [Sitodiplosis mosellana]